MRRFIPVIIFVLAVAAAYAWFNRVELKEMVVGPEEVVNVPAVSYEEVGSDTRKGVSESEVEAPVTESAEEEVVTEEEVKAPEEEAAKPPAELPAEINLAVPWTPQAPYANWDELHEDTCEEISVYMVHLYYEGVPAGLVDSGVAEATLQEMTAAETAYLGFWEDTTAAETAEFAKQYYGYDYELIDNPTVDEIKAEVAAGYPVLVPMAGKILANPYFTPPGPDYHMLVVKGYTSGGFITNDPGTRHGENWAYGFDHFMESIHDWNGGDVVNGQKVVIVLKP